MIPSHWHALSLPKWKNSEASAENSHLQQITAKELYFGRCARVSDRQNPVFFKQGAILPTAMWQDIPD